jgi:glycine dehydrogenase subunit 2
MYKLDPPALLFETSRPGRATAFFPGSDVPDRPIEELIPAEHRAEDAPPLPELGELDIVRHYTNLSALNMAIDANFYPLGSCTMKYNPKRNERLAALPGLAAQHPYQDEGSLQGLLEILFRLQEMLAEIAGLDAVSLQPAAGAHGELTALLVAAAYFRDRGQTRTKVLIPDSAHGTNPSSAHLAGFEAVTIKSDARGLVDLDAFRAALDDRTAVFMITNPNTVGLFDPQVGQIAQLLHERGALLYLDGANMNAILGVVRPGDMGVDLMHYNPHKTFSGPHGGGGPGAGPIAVRAGAGPLPAQPPGPAPRRRLLRARRRPAQVDRAGAGVLRQRRRARPRLLLHPHAGAGRAEGRRAARGPQRQLPDGAGARHVPGALRQRCMHEFVASARGLARERGVRAMDIAKRLIDHNVHAPTVYFPLIVPEALMIEPTETESRETLEAFARTLRAIAEEDPQTLHDAPLTTPISRPDEVAAAKTPVLRWTPAADVRPPPRRTAAGLRAEPRGRHPVAADGMICRVYPHEEADGPAHMARDEAMLDAVAADPEAAAFRTYGWAVPTLSLGYFQGPPRPTPRPAGATSRASGGRPGAGRSGTSTR